MDDWRCTCGATSKDDKMMCWHCGEEREFCMTANQARVVVRELNRLERQRDDAIALFWAANRMALRPHQKQSCGHERRFIVGTDEGTNWCLFCEAQQLRVLADRLMRENAGLRMVEEATDESN